jgi:hypothetical protein
MEPESPPRPSMPWWGWVLLFGAGAFICWWVVTLIFRTLLWGVRTLIWIVVIGGIIYLVMAATGHRPGRD